MRKMLFLGYGPEQTGLLGEIKQRGWDVTHQAEPVSDLSGFDLVISYGYRHILKANVLATARRPPINLHIAYLPFNRGAHPLFWAAYEGTPIGVTIHEIDPGIDTGPICFQEPVELDKSVETFASGYTKLIAAMESLFIDQMDRLLDADYEAVQQQGHGTTHRVRDLPSGFAWSDLIAPTIERLKI